MPQLVYYAALSLDGRIAGPGHDLAFLQTLERGLGNDYEEFYAGVDVPPVSPMRGLPRSQSA